MINTVEIVEAGYDLQETEREWLLRLCGAASSALDRGFGLFAYALDVSLPYEEWLSGDVVSTGEDRYVAACYEAHESVTHDSYGRLFAGPPGVATVSQIHGRIAELPWFRPLRETFGARDTLGVRAVDRAGRGFAVLTFLREAIRLRPQSVTVWRRLADHWAAGLRLRRSLVAEGAAREEAVLDPSGRVVHAAGIAHTPDALSSLRLALRARDRARGPMRKHDPMLALTTCRPS